MSEKVWIDVTKCLKGTLITKRREEGPNEKKRRQEHPLLAEKGQRKKVSGEKREGWRVTLIAVAAGEKRNGVIPI